MRACALLAAATSAAAQTRDPDPHWIEIGNYITSSVVTTKTDVAHGHTAFSLVLQPRDGINAATAPRSVYALFGEKDNLLTLPPAFHVEAPFGCDIGGVNPAFYPINADSEWDSWLTVGITTGDVHNLMSSIGIDWTTWTPTTGVSVDDGAVFWMDPDDAPAFADNAEGVVVGQMTIETGTPACVIMSAQGRGASGSEDWEEKEFRFALNGGCAGQGGVVPKPPPPPPPPPVHVPPPPPPPDQHASTGCAALPRMQQGMTISYRAGPTPDCKGRMCLPYPVASIAMIRCTAPLQLINQDDGNRRVLSFAEVRCGQDNRWSALTSTCEMPVAAPVAPPPPPANRRPPPPPPAAVNPAGTCDVATMSSQFAQINNVCCHQAGLTCDNGSPSTCSTACRGIVLDLWANCHTLIQQMPAGFTALDEFVGVCQSGNGNQAGNVADALASLKDTTGGPAMAGGSQMQFSCTYTELTGLALQCSSVTAPTTAGDTIKFCSSPCAEQLLPFSAQCSSTMQAALNTFGLEQMFETMISTCNPAMDDHTLCPIDIIDATCTNLVNPGGDAGTLCATSCLQTVSNHFDACSTSTDPRVRSSFSATSWAPLVQLCNSQAPAVHGGDDHHGDVDTQCANIKSAMSTQLSDLCCSDAQCSVVPSFCPTACSDALLPYFHSCAAQLAVSDPALMSRLTSLATACTSQHGGGGH